MRWGKGGLLKGLLVRENALHALLELMGITGSSSYLISHRKYENVSRQSGDYSTEK